MGIPLFTGDVFQWARFYNGTLLGTINVLSGRHIKAFNRPLNEFCSFKLPRSRMSRYFANPVLKNPDINVS